MEFRCPKCRKKLPAGVPTSAKKLKVGDVMSREPVTLGPEESLMRGLEVMRMNRIRRVPIVLGDKLIGLLTEGDLNAPSRPPCPSPRRTSTGSWKARRSRAS